MSGDRHAPFRATVAIPGIRITACSTRVRLTMAAASFDVEAMATHASWSSSLLPWPYRPTAGPRGGSIRPRVLLFEYMVATYIFSLRDRSPICDHYFCFWGRSFVFSAAFVDFDESLLGRIRPFIDPYIFGFGDIRHLQPRDWVMRCLFNRQPER
jgi:hypothetical protein